MAPKDTDKAQDTRNELRTLRDKQAYLNRKLKSINEKHEAAKSWISENERLIVVRSQQFANALKEAESSNDLTPALNILKSSGETAGLILDIPMYGEDKRYAQKVEEQFSTSSAKGYNELVDFISKTPLGVPQSALTFIDEQADQDIAGEKQNNESKANEKSGWWNRVSGKEKKTIDAELSQVKSELLGIQMTPAYARAMSRSFFDYVEHATLRKHTDTYTQDKDPEIDHLLEQFKNAEYIVNIAQHDFNETLTAFTDNIVGLTHSYIRFRDYLNNLDPKKDAHNQGTELAKILQNSPDLDKIIRWFVQEEIASTGHSKSAEDPDIDLFSLFYNSSLYIRLGGMSEGFLEHLNTVNMATSKPYIKNQEWAQIFFTDALEAILDENKKMPLQRSIDIVLQQLAQAATQEPISLADILEKSQALTKIYNSSLPEQNKISLSQKLLQTAGMDLSFHYSFGLKDIYELQAGRLANVFFSLDNDSNNREEMYAVMKAINPDFDLVKSALNHKDHYTAAKLFMLALKNNVNMPEQIGVSSQHLKAALTNALTLDTWQEIIPELYALAHDPNATGVNDQIKEVLTDTIEDTDERLIDKIVKTGDMQRLATVLSFMPLPVMRTNFLRSLAEDAPTKALGKTYTQMADILDTQYLEYENGHLLDTHKLLNAYYSDNKVSYIADGQLLRIDSPIADAHAEDIFVNLINRDHLLHIGNEILNPQHLDFVTLEHMNNGECYLNFLSDGYASHIGIPADEGQTTIQAILEKNPDLMQLDNSFINKERINYIYFSGNTLHIICGDTCVLFADCTDETKKNIIDLFQSDDNFVVIGDHIINTKVLDTASYMEDSQEIVLMSNGTQYYKGANVTMMDKTYGIVKLPGIPCKDKQTAKSIISKIAKNKSIISVDTAAVHKDAISMISKNPKNKNKNNFVFTFIKQKKIDLVYDQLSPSEEQNLKEKVERAADLTSIKGTSYNANHIQNIWQSNKDNMTYLLMNGQHISAPILSSAETNALTQKMENVISTGHEFIDPDTISHIRPSPMDQNLLLGNVGPARTKFTVNNAQDTIAILQKRAHQKTGQAKKASYDATQQFYKRSLDIECPNIDHESLREKRQGINQPAFVKIFGEDYKTKEMDTSYIPEQKLWGSHPKTQEGFVEMRDEIFQILEEKTNHPSDPKAEKGPWTHSSSPWDNKNKPNGPKR